MASPILGRFDTWLSEKLLNLNQDVDLDVFVSYISGILEADTPEDEKSESLFGILGELVESSAIEDECQEIIKKWKEMSSDDDAESKAIKDVDCIDFKIHSIIEQQNASQASRVQPVSKESQERKAVILAQYAEISDGEDLDDVPGEGKPVTSTSAGAAASAASSSAALSNEELLVKNMNALLVKERERGERDRAKQEAEHKKQKDKEDRERQKQKAQERKETEKKRTQKGDKKR